MADYPIAIRLTEHAMGTEFALMLLGEDREPLVEGGNQAMEEILAVERELSHTLGGSALCRINACAASEPVRVAPQMFDLLAHARMLFCETGGAFDITTGALLERWGFLSGRGRLPQAEEVTEALRLCGWSHVWLNEDDCTISFDREGVALNMGAIGKGYALDRAAEVLKDRGVTIALLHGGRSSVVALGTPPSEKGWGIGLPHPADPSRRVGAVVLRDAALGVSGAQKQHLEYGGKRYGHILDPRTGGTCDPHLAVAVVGETGTDTDALATAFAVLGPAGAEEYCQCHSSVGAAFVSESGEPSQPLLLGDWDGPREPGRRAWHWEGNYHERR